MIVLCVVVFYVGLFCLFYVFILVLIFFNLLLDVVEGFVWGCEL